MSKTKNPCIFDKSKECPVRDVWIVQDYGHLVEHACRICPVRIEMLPEGKREKSYFG